jgi:hypothetical protein
VSTRDLGKHFVELHELGMLAITGEGVRQTLSSQEALDLLNWLDLQRSHIEKNAQASLEENVPEVLLEETSAPDNDPDDREMPEDEP